MQRGKKRQIQSIGKLETEDQFRPKASKEK